MRFWDACGEYFMAHLPRGEPCEGCTQSCKHSFEVAFDASDSKEQLLKSFKDAMEDKPDIVFAVGRRGYQDRMQGEKEMMVNYGVVAALVLSVSAGMLELEELPDPPYDDRWNDHRKDLAEWKLIFASLSAACAVAAVGLSSIFAAAMQWYVHDLDDFLWYIGIGPSGFIAWASVAALLLLELAIGISVVLQLPEKWADYGLLAHVVVSLFAAFFALTGFLCPRTRCSKSVSVNKEKWTAAIDAAYNTALWRAATERVVEESAGRSAVRGSVEMAVKAILEARAGEAPAKGEVDSAVEAVLDKIEGLPVSLGKAVKALQDVLGGPRARSSFQIQDVDRSSE